MYPVPHITLVPIGHTQRLPMLPCANRARAAPFEKQCYNHDFPVSMDSVRGRCDPAPTDTTCLTRLWRQPGNSVQILTLGAS